LSADLEPTVDALDFLSMSLIGSRTTTEMPVCCGHRHGMDEARDFK
jgi:hypothetical protein